MAAGIAQQITESFRPYQQSLGAALPATRYRLTFEIGGARFSSVFSVDGDDGITNGCISFIPDDCSVKIESYISTNSATKRCFEPPLSKETVPAGTTQTDILQVLSSKLKFAACPDVLTLEIDDIAFKPGHRAHLSAWRLMRGEPGIYEKYGYRSPLFEEARARAQRTTFREIEGTVAAAVAIRHYPHVFTAPTASEQTIAFLMQQIPYEDLAKSMTEFTRPGGYGRELKSLEDLLFEALMDGKSYYYNSTLTLVRSSDAWRHWDSELKFLEWVPVVSGGGRRSRRTHARRRIHARPLRPARAAVTASRNHRRSSTRTVSRRRVKNSI